MTSLAERPGLRPIALPDTDAGRASLASSIRAAADRIPGNGESAIRGDSESNERAQRARDRLRMARESAYELAALVEAMSRHYPEAPEVIAAKRRAEAAAANTPAEPTGTVMRPTPTSRASSAGEDLAAAVAAVRAERDELAKALRADIAERDRTISGLYAELRTAADAGRDRVRSLEAKLAAANAARDEAQRELADRTGAAERAGRVARAAEAALAEVRQDLAALSAERDALALEVAALGRLATGPATTAADDAALLARIGMVEIPEAGTEIAAAAREGAVWPVPSNAGTIRAYGRTRTLLVVAGRSIRLVGPGAVSGNRLHSAAWRAIAADLDHDEAASRKAELRGMAEVRRLWCHAMTAALGLTLTEAAYAADRLGVTRLGDPATVSYHAGVVRRRLEAMEGVRR